MAVENRDLTALLRVLDEVMGIVTAFPQDTTWSRWATADSMIAELCDHADRLRAGDLSMVRELSFLFAPTGSLQEVSLSSGWGERFVAVAERFDHAFDAAVSRRQQ